MKDKKPEPNIACYNLSAKQNVRVISLQNRITSAREEFEKARQAADDALRLSEAKKAAADARQAAFQGAVEAQQLFFEYIIDEFDLPKPKSGNARDWTPREVEKGVFALYAEVDAAVEPPAPPAPPVGPDGPPAGPTGPTGPATAELKLTKQPKHKFKGRGKGPVLAPSWPAPVPPPVMEPPKPDTNNQTETTA